MASKLNRVRKLRWLKRMRTHGFRARMLTRTGRQVLRNRRAKGRHSLAVQKQS